MSSAAKYVQVGIRVPTVHMNGTPSSRLRDDAIAVTDRLHEVLIAMDTASPNARDYYPQGDNAFRQAVEQHNDRVLRVQSVIAELVAIVEQIDDQVEKHTRR